MKKILPLFFYSIIVFIILFSEIFSPLSAQSIPAAEQRDMYVLWVEDSTSIWNVSQASFLKTGDLLSSNDSLRIKKGPARLLVSDKSNKKRYRLKSKYLFQEVGDFLYKILTPFLFQERGREANSRDFPLLAKEGVYFEAAQLENELWNYKKPDSSLYLIKKCTLRIDHLFGKEEDNYVARVGKKSLPVFSEKFLIIKKSDLSKRLHSAKENPLNLEILNSSAEGRTPFWQGQLPLKVLSEKELKAFFERVKSYTKALEWSQESYEKELFLAFWFNYGLTDFKELRLWLRQNGFLEKGE